jgi:hypothetical protein
MRLIFFFNLSNPSSRIMALGSTQPLTKMSTRNLPGGVKGRLPARKANNLTAICAKYLKMWESQPLANLRASTACTVIVTFTFTRINEVCASRKLA